MTTQRIAVIGAGAIGGFYGIQLAKAGHAVQFLLRSDFSVAREHGLRLESARLGDHHVDPQHIFAAVEAMQPCDWVLVSAKTTSNPCLAPLINRVAAQGARVLLLQNGLAVEDELRPLLRDDLHLLGGLCMVIVHRVAAARIEHSAGGRLSVGYHSGPPGHSAGSELAACATLFDGTAIDLVPMVDLAQARWQKLLVNIPFSGLSVLLDSGTRKLLDLPETCTLLRELMEEVAAGAAVCGQTLPPDSVEVAWASTDRPDYCPSMYLDFHARRPLELHAMYAAPLREVARAGGQMPKVEMLYQTLRFIDERNQQMAASAA